jgi:hypothetical protein
MDEGGRWDGKPGHGDPDVSPWPIVALGVVLALICLALIAKAALAMLIG